jgi:hypothetical protein
MSRKRLVAAAALGTLFLAPAPSAAQGQALGIGGRFSLVRPDAALDTLVNRYAGGQIRARLSPRAAVEVALDRRRSTNDALTERVTEYPIQASLLLYPVRSTLSPYLLGGMGWYTQRIQTLAGDAVQASETTRRTGYHAGIGGELRLGAHAAAHADYRYTFIRLGQSEEAGGLADRLKPSHEGSMWTAGLTVYF